MMHSHHAYRTGEVGLLTARSQVAVDKAHPELQRVVDCVSEVIVGKEHIVRLILVAIVAGGHCLIEDVPGVGKTTLVKAVSRALGCEFKRIQFTPDILPSDVTGVSIYNQKTQEFEFRPGPIFAQVVLADEINRTSPKTQAALLEALEEHHVTVDGHAYRLPSPFFLMATENPIDFEGTFPLPEAQVDRFLLKLKMGYPTLEEELAILDRQTSLLKLDELQPVMNPDRVLHWRRESANVHVANSVREYIVQLVQATREHPAVYLGASPRASIALFRAAQALAFLGGRDYVVPDDVQYLAPYVLEHRILLSTESRLSGQDSSRIVREVMEKIPVPIIGDGR
jgi:MoxR-like ATPase